jgi:hypothetical protein
MLRERRAIKPLAAMVLAVAFALVSGAPLADADKGVALDVGTVRVEQKLSRGGSYNLPPIGVRNPGDETTAYVMGIDFVEDQEGRRPKESWFSFEPQRFTLEPGDTTRVRIELDVPPGARPDDYETLVVASIVTEEEGAALGGAAAARLNFTVKASNWFEAWLLRARYWFLDNAPWSYLIPSAIALVILLWVARRRFAFRIERR